VGLGIGHPKIEQTVGTRKLLSMLGLASQRTRTAEGLAGVLQHAVPDATITVTEFHPVWIQLNEFEPTALGENCVLGRGFHDRGNCARVVISPTTHDSVLSLTPGHQMHSEVMALLSFYLGYESNAHLEMHVSPDLMPKADIASDQVRLGYTSQLQQNARPYATGAITRVQLGMWDGRTANTRTTH
jgi:type VI secretion system protein ImpH